MNCEGHVGTARRSLFGPINHDQLRLDLSQRLRDITKQDSRRWNFDFQSGTPLPGRFQWEEVPAHCAATFYGQESRDAPVKEQTEQAEERLRPREEAEEEDVLVSDQENCPRVSNTTKHPAELTPARRKRARSKSAARTPQTTRITDFFAKKRRSTETKSSMTPIFPQSTDAHVRTLR